VYHENKHVIEVVSSSSTSKTAFETTEEPDYLVQLPEDAAVGVLQSKERFEWDDESTPLHAGTALIFRDQS
jgi:fatty acid synthase subunit beta